MQRRCKSPHRHNANSYVEKGIEVCTRWLKFENFLADMGERPKNMTLDRLDNGKGYNPENCRWATAAQQAQNQTSTKLNATDVQRIRDIRHVSGLSHRQLGAYFNVAHTTIGGILRGTSWA